MLPPCKSTILRFSIFVSLVLSQTPLPNTTQRTLPSSTKTMPDLRSSEKIRSMLPSSVDICTWPTLVKRTGWDLTDWGMRGGKPSYLTASRASSSKLGVLGACWAWTGFGTTCGFSSCAIPSMKTCRGAAPSARGWLSQTTISGTKRSVACVENHGERAADQRHGQSWWIQFCGPAP